LRGQLLLEEVALGCSMAVVLPVAPSDQEIE
jgi:hypothetical protein